MMSRRPGSLFEHELAWFKANETPESVLLLDDSLLRFLAVWKQVIRAIGHFLMLTPWAQRTCGVSVKEPEQYGGDMRRSWGAPFTHSWERDRERGNRRPS